MKKNSLVILFILSLVSTNAQDITKAEKKNIFESLESVDSINRASVHIHQDKRIELALTERKAQSQASGVTSGYRVQVFSSNTQRTAKAEAYKVEKELRDFFPEHTIYVNYTAPFWKVRVGDFRSMQEAQSLRTEIIKTFPSYRSETYTVKDQINY